MGFRFRRSIRLLPGVRLNLSKGTPSISVGPRGFTANIGKRGVRGTAGLPGSGLSYTTSTARWNGADGAQTTRPDALPPPARRGVNPMLVAIIVAAAVLVLVYLGNRPG
jgi:hypothetical protein